MKKTIIFLAMLVLTISATAQNTPTDGIKISDKEAVEIIKKSQQYNQLKNPDLIFPGQELTYLFATQDSTVIVEKGDNQTKIVKKIAAVISALGPITSGDEDLVEVSLPAPVMTEAVSPLWDFIETYLVWSLIILCILLFFITWLIKTKPWKAEGEPKEEMDERFRSEIDPVAAGDPVVPGGIRDLDHAREYLESRATDLYEDKFNLREITPGYLHAENAQVTFGNDRKRTLNFRNQRGYRGVIDITGEDEQMTEQVVYFLQGCGNDVRQLEYMLGGIRFTTEEIPEDVFVVDVQSTPVATRTSTETSAHRSVHQSNQLIGQVDIVQVIEKLSFTGQAFTLHVIEGELIVEMNAKETLIPIRFF